MPRPGARPRPPRDRRTRERKIRAALPFYLRKLANAATETADAVEAIWEAIPWKDRIRYHEGKKHPTPQDQARAIYDLFDKIAWDQAIENLIKNQLEDYAFGKLGQTSKKARNTASDYLPNTGRGFQSGPWDTFTGENLPPRPLF